MQKKLKPLSINRETLGRLEPRDRSGVAGGTNPPDPNTVDCRIIPQSTYHCTWFG